MHQVHLQGKVLAADAVLAGRVEVELLQLELANAAHQRRAAQHHFGRGAEVLEADVLARDVGADEAGGLNGDAAV